MKTKERLIDLSDIKDDELDKTASFTDLMTRSERKKREKEKKKNIENIKIDKDITNDNIVDNLNIENVSDVENIEEVLSQTKQYEDLTKTIDKEIKIEDNYDDYDEEIEEKKYGSGLIITMGLFLLISTGIFIYSILLTNNLDKNNFLYIDIISLAIMYFLFSISLITGRKFSKFLSILNYIIFIIFIAFNVLITLNYIK